MSRLNKLDASFQDVLTRNKLRFKEEILTEENKNKLKQLAIDIVENRVFCSNQITDNTLAASIFLPLMFLKTEDIPWDTYLCYAYYDKALTRSINGYPTFLEVNIVRKTSFMHLADCIERYNAHKNKF